VVDNSGAAFEPICSWEHFEEFLGVLSEMTVRGTKKTLISASIFHLMSPVKNRHFIH